MGHLKSTKSTINSKFRACVSFLGDVTHEFEKHDEGSISELNASQPRYALHVHILDRVAVDDVPRRKIDGHERHSSLWRHVRSHPATDPNICEVTTSPCVCMGIVLPVASSHVQMRTISSPKLEVIKLEFECFVVRVVELVVVLDIYTRLHLKVNNTKLP